MSYNKTISVDCEKCVARLQSVFCELNPDEVKNVSHYNSVSVYGKKKVIFHQGALAHGVYTVYSGKVKIYQNTENGKEQIIRMARKGDVLGYRALLTGEKYNCTAETIEDSNICFIPKSVFFSLIDQNLSVSRKLLQLLSVELKRAENKISTLIEKPVKERLAEAILFLKEIYGMEADNCTLNIILTREEIANLVGTSKETAIRLLYELKDDKILEFMAKKIKIRNFQGLSNLANLKN